MLAAVLLAATAGVTVPAGVRAATATANPDSVTVVQGVTATVFPLRNDVRGSGGPFNAPADVAPSSGTTAAGGSYACGLPGGRSSCRYTPPTPAYLGADSFPYGLAFPTSTTTYTSVVSSSTISLTVVANQPPTAVDDSATVYGSALAQLSTTENDADPNLGQGDVLMTVTASFASSNGGSVQCGAAFNGCQYRAASGFTGTDAFDYTVRDANGLTDVGTVTVTVLPNTPPTAVDDAAAYHVAYGGSPIVRQVAVTGNDTDPDGQWLQAAAVGPTTAQGASVSCSGGACTYAPATGFFGTDTFDYVASDDAGGFDQATVTVTLTPDGPPVAGDDAAAGRGTGLVQIPVFDNDTDPEGELRLLSFDATSAAGGSVSCGTDSGTALYRGCQYRAAAGFAGTDTFTYRVGDASDVNADTATVTVTVAPNQSPLARPDVYDADYEPFDHNPVVLRVLLNDADPEGDALDMPVQFLTSAMGRSVVCAASDCEYSRNVVVASGIDSFSYTVGDGHGGQATATVSIYITLNAPPIAADDSVITRPGVAVSVNVLANDCDPNCSNPPGTVAADAASARGGTVQCFDDIYHDGSFGRCVYTPPAGLSGTDSFGYVLTDQEGAIDTATVTVAVTDEETASAVLAPGGTVSTDTEGDGASPNDPVEASVTTGAAGGTVTIAERPTASPTPGGFTLLGLEVVVSAPAGTVSEPLQLSFVLDRSLVPAGKIAGDVTVFRNGVAVPPCTGPAGTASPDPCVAGRLDLPDGDVRLSILTSRASTWGFGTAASFPFTGFFAPVDNPPVQNAMKGGRAVAVSFSLGGDRGLGILAAGSPSSVRVSCASSAVVDEVETTITAGASSLSYDKVTDRYTYVWKTDKAWAGTCRELRVALTDGTIHTALFRFS